MEISETMNAVVTHCPHDYRFKQVKVPHTSKHGEILLKIEGCGICAGDIKAYKGGEVFWGNGSTSGYLEPPAIGGHEFVGVIVEIADTTAAEKSLKKGDRVVVEQIVPCGECRYCKRGDYSICVKHDVFGFKYYLNGGFAEYALMPNNAHVFKIPDDMRLEDAVLVEPYACSYHAVERAKIKNEDIVVISGCGPLGLGMVTAAKQKKAAKIIALDMFDKRLDHADAFGADIVINPSKINAVEEIHGLTDGYGCDVYIEATGHPSSVTQGLEAIRKNGNFVEFSLFNDTVTYNWSVIGDSKELNIYGSSLSPGCFPPVIDGIYSGLLNTKGIVTHSFKLEEFKAAFDICMEGRDSIKVMLTP
jgi:threonine dehydrogenase-like Zn-dependent dehydrogenase